MKQLCCVACLLALLLSVAQLGNSATATKPDAGNVAKGKTLYQQKGCVPCHGEAGKGDGPVAKSIDPKPTNFTDAKVMSKLTDAQLNKAIKLGGKAVGKAPTMPAYGEKMSDAEIKDVVAFVRSLTKSKPEKK